MNRHFILHVKFSDHLKTLSIWMMNNIFIIFLNAYFVFDRTAAAFCVPLTRETITTYPCGTGRRTKRVTRSRRPRSVELLTTITAKYRPCGLPPFRRRNFLCLSLFFCRLSDAPAYSYSAPLLSPLQYRSYYTLV